MSDLTGTQASAQIEAARQAQLDDFRKNAAYNALVQSHGAAAGDPEAWAQVEAAQAAQDVEPYRAPAAAAEVTKAQLENADTSRQQQGQALYSVAQMAKSAARPDGSIDPDAYDKLFSNPLVQKATGITPDQVTQARPLLTGPGGVAHLDTIANAALGPGKVTGAGIPIQNADGSYGMVKTTTTGRVIGLNLPNGAQPTAPLQGQERIDVARQRVQQAAQNANVQLTPGGLALATQTYIRTGQMPAFGIGGAKQKTEIINNAAASGATGDQVTENAQTYKSKQTALNDLSKSSPTSAGGLVRSAGAVIQHIDTLDQLIGALQNKNLKAANALSQRFKQETGQPAPTNFDLQKQIVSSELSKFLQGGRSTLTDRKELQDSISKANSPQQLRHVITLMKADLGAQLGAQYAQFEGQGAGKEYLRTLTPAARFMITGVAEPSASLPQQHPAPGNNGVVDYRSYFGAH